MTSLWLVGDVGGTNCRLALARADAPLGAFEAAARYDVAAFPTPEEAIAAFLAHERAPAPARIALAVAGPVADGRAALTNAAWRFDQASLSARFGADARLLNDLAAQAWGLIAAPEAAYAPIGQDLLPRNPLLSIVSPGTGLGVAFAWTREPFGVFAAEGGHLGFAPRDEFEVELWRRLAADVARPCWEHILSGPGLARLHGHPALAGPEIMRRGLAGDAACAATLQRFAGLLGTFCGDVARMHGSGAVYLTGAIARDLAPILRDGVFRARFEEGGPSPEYLQAVPTRLGLLEEPGLFGAHAALRLSWPPSPGAATRSPSEPLT